MSLSLPDYTVEMVLDVHEELNKQKVYIGDIPHVPLHFTHDMIDHVAREANYIALAGAGNRLVTAREISEITGIPLSRVKANIAILDEKGRSLEPVKTIGPVKLYTLEDIPTILNAHLENTNTSTYVSARIRKAIKLVSNAQSVRRLQEINQVRWPTWNGKPRTVSFDLDKSMIPFIKEEMKDGWRSVDEFVRGLVVAYVESRKGYEKFRKEHENDPS